MNTNSIEIDNLCLVLNVPSSMLPRDLTIINMGMLCLCSVAAVKV